MADNGTAASAPTIAWDEIGGVAYQRVKVTYGPDGSSTDVSSSNRLPVDPGTVPVTGPLTNTELRATAVPVSVSSPEASASFRGRANTFRTPGRAGTTGQKIFALHNATGSTKVIRVNELIVDMYQTVVKAIAVAPPIIRVHRFTALPTNGTALAKVAKDTLLTSSAAVTAWGDSSADGTGSATTLTVTIPAGGLLTQIVAPRVITAAGYETVDRMELLADHDIVLRPLEGIVVFLDYVLATQNPVTDMWVVGCDWWEI